MNQRNEDKINLPFNSSKNDEDKKYDFRKYIAKDGDDAGFEFIPASDEQMEKARIIAL